MKCPICGNHETKVIDSRSWKDGVKRRRECQECFTRFSTSETVIIHSLPKYLLKKVNK